MPFLPTKTRLHSFRRFPAAESFCAWKSKSNLPTGPSRKRFYRRRSLARPARGLNFVALFADEENGQTIRALEYEAYPEMAGREIRRLLQEISTRHPCRAAKVIHRVGVIPVGETAIYVGVASPHRGRGHRVARRIHGPAQAGRADLETAGDTVCSRKCKFADFRFRSIRRFTSAATKSSVARRSAG